MSRDERRQLGSAIALAGRSRASGEGQPRGGCSSLSRINPPQPMTTKEVTMKRTWISSFVTVHCQERAKVNCNAATPSKLRHKSDVFRSGGLLLMILLIGSIAYGQTDRKSTRLNSSHLG